MSKKILVTGGAGYIGSHVCIELLKRKYDVMVFDNLISGSETAVRRVRDLSKKKLDFVCGDIRDEVAFEKAVNKFRPHTIMHFAGLKSVSESVSDPLSYYDVNVRGSLNILRVMSKSGCNELIFSSSATLYDNKKTPPYSETSQTNPISPYGRTKLIFELAINDWVNSNIKRKAVCLRYFNPVGAHGSGLIGEDLKNNTNNIMPLIAQVANGSLDILSVYGDNHLTRDGTGERDYIHVVDLASGHVKSLESLDALARFEILNLGTGKGTTVKELVHAFEKTNNVKVPFKIVAPREGDVSTSIADPTKSCTLIGFQCTKSIKDICADVWNWQIKNPKGYDY